MRMNLLRGEIVQHTLIVEFLYKEVVGKMNKRGKWFRSIILGFTCLSLVGCLANSPVNQSGLEEKIVVYSPHGKDILADFEKRFEAKYPGVDVQWLDMGSQDVLDRVRSEKTNPQGDIWWGAPSVMFEQATKEGLLEPYQPSYHSSIPEKYRDPQFVWTGTSQTPEVIMYNEQLVSAKDVPKDWDDILEPVFKDKVMIRFPLASGTMRTIFTAMIYKEMNKEGGSEEKGFEWLKRLDQNTKEYVSSPEIMFNKIAKGEATITLWNMPEAVMLRKKKNYPFNFVIPESGTPILTEGIALIKGGKHSKAAQAFYEFVNSPESTKILAEKYYRIPTRTDITDLPTWIKETKLIPMELDQSLIKSKEKEWMEKWDREIKNKSKEMKK